MADNRVLLETRVSELRAGDLWLYDGAWVLLTEVTPAEHPDDRVQLLYRQAGETESEFTNPRGNEVAVVKREPASTDRPFMVWEGSLENLRAWVERWVADPSDYTLLPQAHTAALIIISTLSIIVRPGDRIVLTLASWESAPFIAVVNHS